MRLSVDLQSAAGAVSAVTLKSHQPSPLARKPVSHIQALTTTP